MRPAPQNRDQGGNPRRNSVHFLGACSFTVVLLIAGACGPPINQPDDETAPSFVHADVLLLAPTPPTERGIFSILSSDVERNDLGANLTLRVAALAGDPESNVTISVTSELRWRCAFGADSEVIGTYQTTVIPFSPEGGNGSTTTAGIANQRVLNVVADPIGATGCDMSAPGRGPVDLDGLVRLTATNSAGLAVTTKTFLFDYGDIGVRS